MKKVTVTEVSTLTGEVNSYTFKKRVLNTGGFSMHYDENIVDLTVLLGKSGDPYSSLILTYLCCTASFNTNRLHTSISLLAKEIGFSRRTVSKSLAKLNDLQAIFFFHKEGTMAIEIVINPYIRFKGSAEYAKIARDEWDRRLNGTLVKRKIAAVK